MRHLTLTILLLMLLCLPISVLGVGLPAGTPIQLLARSSYSDAGNQTYETEALVVLTVAQVAGVNVTNSQSPQPSVGDTCYIPVTVTNTGNGVDSFNLTTSSSVTGWNVSLVYDDNGDGVHQSTEDETVSNTQNLVPDGKFPCFIKVQVPANATTGSNINIRASSALDALRGTSAAKVSVPTPKKATTSISVSSNETDITVGSTVTVTGTLSPAMVAPVSITSTKPDGSKATTSVNTDNQGRFTWPKVVDAAGSWSISVAYAGDSQHEACSKSLSISATGTNPSDHTISITSGPSASPSSVNTEGTATMSVSATDSQNHSLTYLWSDGSAGGHFSPSAIVQSPTYTAPANASGSDTNITITVKISCAQDAGVFSSGATTLAVHSGEVVRPNVTSVSPQDASTSVGPSTQISIMFDQQMNESATQQAITITPQLQSCVYGWTSDDKTLIITHADMAGDTQYTVNIGTGAKSKAGANMTADYSWSFTSASNARFVPNRMEASAGASFVTPPIVLSDSSMPSSISLSIYVPAGISIDTTTNDNTLACVQQGSDVDAFTSNWVADTRTIEITAESLNPAASMEIVHSITLTAPIATAESVIKLNGDPGLCVTTDGSQEVVITSGPSLNLTEVNPNGNVSCDVSAVDSSAHEIIYSWSDGDAGGSFSPSGNVASPIYTAPSNDSNSNKSVTITCQASCSQNPNASDSGTVTLMVRPHKVAIASGPSISASQVASSGSVNGTVTASDSAGHRVTYVWSDGGAGGSFTPSASTQNVTYNAPANTSTINRIITLTCTASCSENAERSDSRTVSLTVLPVPKGPDITITSPSKTGTYVTTKATLTVSGKAAATAKQLSWQNDRGGGKSCSGTKSWKASSIPLVIGRNVITVNAIDATGAVGTATLVVTCKDVVKPKIALKSPSTKTSFTVMTSQVVLTGTATDNGGIASVSWTTAGGTKTTCSGTDNWSTGTINLVLGKNVITIEAVDNSGNSITKKVTVTYKDKTAPSVSLVSPTSQLAWTTNEDMLTLSGTATDNVGVAGIKWSASKGRKGIAQGILQWTIAGIKLIPGQNVITITVSDASKNTTKLIVTVTYVDITAPVLSITVPTSVGTYATSSSKLSIGGSVSDNIGVKTLMWTNSKGGSGKCSVKAAWKTSTIKLSAGENVITFTAADASGNKTTASIAVTYTPVQQSTKSK